jgi:hypothetical protein
MLLGGGDIGCNVWVENNDLLFYIARNGTFDENGSMLKLGRVRLHLSPNPFKSSFKQELKLKQVYVEITGDNHTRIKLWPYLKCFPVSVRLQRFSLYPTKFNGALFTFDADFVKGEYKSKVTPDFRRRGGSSFTAQNQRLVYWPMLKSGDFDMVTGLASRLERRRKTLRAVQHHC